MALRAELARAEATAAREVRAAIQADRAAREAQRREGYPAHPRTKHEERIKRGMDRGLSRPAAAGRPREGDVSANLIRELGRAAREAGRTEERGDRNEIVTGIYERLQEMGHVDPSLSVREQAKQFAQFWEDMDWGDYDDGEALFWAMYDDT